ncbi:MFS transporter [Sphingomonas gilva]|uniref:MFS transporter n=1 Tax=Sphingomonas gilva TaxID=2305907 RepID=A0A396RSR3_9SPHN|nr:MFS transporter [Sphingomonas gilva]RHW19116.1 MFS transporter [Sphingomonas gilva]
MATLARSTMRSPWTVILTGAVIVTLAMGVRQSFGLFLPQMGAALDISRSSFGLAIAIQNLVFGLAQPFVGALADKHGAGRIAVGGALLYAAGLVLASLATSAIGIHLSLGLMVGLAMTGITFTVILGVVGRVVPPESRSMAFGIVTAGGSLGQFLVVPGAQALLTEFGYRQALIVMAAAIAAIVALAAGIAGKPSASVDGGPAQSAGQALREAGGDRNFLLLNLGFFVCGFHVVFIATHFPAYLTDKGIDPAIGASSLALIGLFNIFGSYLFGLAGDRLRKQYVLAGLYAARGIAIVLFLLLPLTPVSALVFAGVMGFLWLGTVPLTNGLVSQIYGVRHLSMLGGVVFLSHQVGSFLGAWAAGYMFDLSGNYDAAWTASIVLAALAALIHLPIRDAPIVRAEPA